jgi:hypothetical protein
MYFILPFNYAPLPRPNFSNVCEIISITIPSSMIWYQGSVVDSKEYMGYSILNPHVLCHSRNNQGFKCCIFPGHLGFFQCLVIIVRIRYENSNSPNSYGFVLFFMKYAFFHKDSMFSLKFVLVINLPTELMAHVVRQELNGLKEFLNCDDVTDMLSQVGWLGFIKLFRGFNIEVAKDFMRYRSS